MKRRPSRRLTDRPLTQDRRAPTGTGWNVIRLGFAGSC